MAEKVATILNILNQIAPPRLADDWDNVGLLVGDYSAEVEKVLVSLDVTDEVLNEAIQQGVQLIISHHPMIFKELKNIRADQPTGRLIIKSIQNGINIFAAHTNLDVAKGGINDLLVERLELTDVKPMIVTSTESLSKVVVFVPIDYVDQVRNALSEAGAGWIGNYSHCTFQTEGVGTFMPLEGTNPFIGKQGNLEKVQEMRLETIVPTAKLNKVIKGMIKSHPYEEVAYDIYPLANQGEELGHGRVGYLSRPMMYKDFLTKVKGSLDLPYMRYLGSLERTIKKVAVCGGSGRSFIQKAAFHGVDLYITGDIQLHDAQLAESLGMALIDAGHYWTEVLCVPFLYNLLTDEVKKENLSIQVIQSLIKTDPLTLYK